MTKLNSIKTQLFQEYLQHQKDFPEKFYGLKNADIFTDKQIFASKYLTILPSKEDFIKILEEN